MKIFLTLIAFTLLFSAGCTQTSQDTPAVVPPQETPSEDVPAVVPPKEAEGVEWHLVDVTDTDGNSIATVKTEGLSQNFLLTKATGKISGYDGCNSFNGSYIIDGDKIRTIPPFMQTLKACSFDTEDAFTDDKFQNALTNASSYDIDGENLILFADDIRLVFDSNPPPEIVPDDYSVACEEKGGKWIDTWNECEIGDRKWCEQNGGIFDDCASACAPIGGTPEGPCILMCVQRCAFDR